MLGNKQSYQHGHAPKANGAKKSPTYNAWQRLFRKHRDGEVCVRWQFFVNFLADMGERPPGRKVWLLRKDYSQPWEPGNVYWSLTRAFCPRTAHNRERKVMWDGKMRSLSDLVREHATDSGLRLSDVLKRIDDQGWDAYRAILKPLEKRPRRYFDYNGKKITIMDAVRISGLKMRTIMTRLNYGWDMKTAIETPILQNGVRLAKKKDGPEDNKGQSNQGILLLRRTEGTSGDHAGPNQRVDGGSGQGESEERP